MKNLFLHLGLLAAVASTIGLTACGGSSASNVSLGGTVSGLTSDGLVLVNGFGTLSVAANATTFTFPGRLNIGVSYAISIQAQPTGLTCSVANGSGVASGGDITNVQITCAPNHSLSGTITGLTADGLVLANGSDTVNPAANSTSFTFPTKVAEGSAYGVTVLTQPTGQTCSIASGAGHMGNADVTSVQVNCI